MAESNEKRTYYLRVSGALVEVTEEIYRTYYQFKDRQKHLEHMDRKHGQFSYDALDTSERSGEAMLSDFLAPSIEEIAIANVMYEKLHCSGQTLPSRKAAHPGPSTMRALANVSMLPELGFRKRS